MNDFRYCPWCGDRLRPPDVDGGAYCARDDRMWYRNPAPTVGAAIVDNLRALATVRARHPEKGRYDVPGGFLHIDEAPVEGLKREVEEELGIEIAVSDRDYLQAAPHRYGDEGDWSLALGFRAHIVSGVPSPSDDVADIWWVGIDDLDDLDFAWEHDRELLRKALSDGDR